VGRKQKESRKVADDDETLRFLALKASKHGAFGDSINFYHTRVTCVLLPCHDRADMEAYPEEYVAHNLPLIALAGLPTADSSTDASTTTPNSHQGSGLTVTDNSPPLSGPHADAILDEFLRAHGASLSWSDQALTERAGLIGFKLSSVGRVGMPLTISCPKCSPY
jgi:hypothetical protein